MILERSTNSRSAGEWMASTRAGNQRAAGILRGADVRIGDAGINAGGIARLAHYYRIEGCASGDRGAASAGCGGGVGLRV